MFTPNEVIFCPTNKCNLHCGHCTVTRWEDKLTTQDALNFLQALRKTLDGPSFSQKGVSLPAPHEPFYVGFSGGEPCLNIDFICAVCEKAVNLDFYFDRITTNGQWWKTEEELEEKLTRIYEYGFDGKFGLSWDSFHGGDKNRLITFARMVCEIFGPASLDILSVINPENPAEPEFFKSLSEMADDFGGELISELDEKTGKGTLHIQFDDGQAITVFRFPQSFQGLDSRGWNSTTWFTDDFCQSTGNVFYVHSNKKVSPCCGFANESEELFLGNITDGPETLLNAAAKNQVVETCFCHGLEEIRTKLENKGITFPGTTDDLCTFCDYLCKKQLFQE